MAGREELYLKRIAENTERIAKAIEKLAEARTSKDVKFDNEGLKLTYEKAPKGTITDIKDRKWVPCSERLPEHTGTYLVTDIVAVDKYVTTGWYSTKGSWICDGYVEAWMPLPEPYKKEEENNSDNSGWDPLWDGR